MIYEILSNSCVGWRRHWQVMPEGIRVLDVVAKKHQLNLRFDHYDFASCDYYLKHGQMMPDNWKETMDYDAIYYGAVGWPETVLIMSRYGALIQFRRQFEQYCLRPVKLMPGVPSPLADREVGDIDFYVVRENSEGEYSSVGGIMNEGTEHEFALQESVFTRRGVDRIMRYAFELAKTLKKNT